MKRYKMYAYVAYAGSHDEHATYDAEDDNDGEWVRADDAMTEIARMRLLLSECLTKFEAYGADYIHAKPTNLLRRIRAELDTQSTKAGAPKASPGSSC